MDWQYGYRLSAAEPAQPAKPDVTRGQAIPPRKCARRATAPTATAPGRRFPSWRASTRNTLSSNVKDYKTQPGAKAPLRNNPIMAGIAGALSDQDMLNVAAYFESQKSEWSFARNKNDVALGQQICRGGIADKGVPACAACHGATGMGIPRCSIRGCRGNGAITRWPS